MDENSEPVHKVNKPARAKRAKKKSFYDLPLEPDTRPRYEATDDDLPVSLWPDPNFEEEK